MAQSKAAFVRSLPASTPAREVIAKAKAAGIKLSPAYIYVIRSKSGAAQAGSKQGAKAKGGRSASGSVERQFVSLALDLGFARAQELLDSVRKSVGL